MLNVYEEAKKVALGILFVIFILFIISYFRMSTNQIIIFLSFINIILLFYMKQFTIKKWIINIIKISIFIYVLKYIGIYAGTLGYVLSILIISLYIIYTRREKWFKTKHHIESMLWGKPLYKFREEGKKPENPFF